MTSEKGQTSEKERAFASEPSSDIERVGLLVIDGDPNFRIEVANFLRSEVGFVDHVGSVQEALSRFGQQTYHMVLLAMHRAFPSEVLGVVERLLRTSPGIALIGILEEGSVELAIAAMQAGAMDILDKPLNLEMLRQRICWAGRFLRMQIEIERLRSMCNSDGSRESHRLSGDPQPSPVAGSLAEAVERSERHAISAALAACDAHRDKTANLLGISVRTLHYKMERYGLY